MVDVRKNIYYSVKMSVCYSQHRVIGGHNSGVGHLSDVQMISTTVKEVKGIQSGASTPYTVGSIRESAVLSPTKEAVYVIGGYYKSPAKSNYVLMYEVDGDKWREDPLPTLIQGRSDACSFVFGTVRKLSGQYGVFKLDR